MVYLSTFATHIAICWAFFSADLSFCNIYSSLLFSSPLQFLSTVYYYTFLVSACLFLPNKSFPSLMFSNVLCDLYASTLWTQTKMFSLLTSLVSFSIIYYLIILALMASSLMPLMNCSFNLLPFSLYLHSSSIICPSTLAWFPLFTYLEYSILMII